MQSISPSYKLNLYFSCKNLRDKDNFTKSDPILKLFLIQNGQTELIGKTETLKNTLDPFFETKISLISEPSLSQTLKAVVFDKDSNSYDDFIGSITFPISDLLASKNQVYRSELHTMTKIPVGSLFINFDKTEVNKPEPTITWQWSISDLINVDWGLWDKTDSYIIFYRKLDENYWFPIYTSEYIKNELNPIYKTFSIGIDRLCGGNQGLEIKIECRDRDNVGKGKLVGIAYLTLNLILKNNNYEFELHNLELEKKRKNVGVLKVDIKKI